MEIKTAHEIVKQALAKDYLIEKNKEFVSVDSLIEQGIEIECQLNGSNNPEDLVDGIFIPYSELKREE